jgi:hypothetical protein
MCVRKRERERERKRWRAKRAFKCICISERCGNAGGGEQKLLYNLTLRRVVSWWKEG